MRSVLRAEQAPESYIAGQRVWSEPGMGDVSGLFPLCSGRGISETPMAFFTFLYDDN